MRRIDYKKGCVIGELTYIEDVESYTSPHGDKCRQAKFLCRCGEVFIARIGHVKNGNIKSCGCYQKEMVSKANTKHGESNSPLYCVWRSIKSRCYYKSSPSYPYYGERGIKMCIGWSRNFYDFKQWAIKNGYEDGLTIDRIDVNGHYTPSNCQFITRAENARFTRRTKLTWADVKTIRLLQDGATPKELAERFGVSPSNISHIINYKTWI